MLAIQEFGEPVKEEPPHGIGRRTWRSEWPRSGGGAEDGPKESSSRVPRRRNQCAPARGAKFGVMPWRAVDGQPGHQPQSAEDSREQERPAPAQAHSNQGDHERRYNRTHIGAGIENAGGQRARSLQGSHSATVLMAAGKLPDSPNPSKKRTKQIQAPSAPASGSSPPGSRSRWPRRTRCGYRPDQ